MAYTNKFQNLADIAMTEVVSVSPEQVNELLAPLELMGAELIEMLVASNTIVETLDVIEDF
jgi:hypothetical protein